MILSKGWRKAASEAWKDEAENAGAFADESPKSNFMNGFEQGAQEMLNAVEQAFKSEVASLKREQERTDNLQYKSDLNQQMEALMLLHFKLQ